MPSWRYSIQGINQDTTALASGRDLRISPKAAREICRYIRGMMLGEARERLREVTELRRPVPYLRHRRKVPHRGGVEGFDAGRYPVKAAGEILKLLDAAEANAEFKGLYPDRLRIVHIAAQRGRAIRKFVPRAFGRASPFFERLTHVEVAVEEV